MTCLPVVHVAFLGSTPAKFTIWTTVSGERYISVLIQWCFLQLADAVEDTPEIFLDVGIFAVDARVLYGSQLCPAHQVDFHI